MCRLFVYFFILFFYICVEPHHTISKGLVLKSLQELKNVLDPATLNEARLQMLTLNQTLTLTLALTLALALALTKTLTLALTSTPTRALALTLAQN